MERAEFERRLATIKPRVAVGKDAIKIDGFTMSEWLEIIRKIEKCEGCLYDTLSIFKYGIDATYPGLRLHYPELFAPV
ncbi:MAG: hypothetical protein WC481_07680 [Candidatus Omnitrophota bacterium]